MSKLTYAFSTIADGNMSFVWGERDEVLKNRKSFLGKFDLDYDNSVMMNVQNHGTDVFEVTKQNIGLGLYDPADAPVVDILVTKEPRVNLLLLTADCFPIIFFDESTPALGLAHSGWRGVHQKIIPKTIESMREKFGSKPENIKVIIGPGISADSYIMKDVAQWDYPEWKPYLTKLETGETIIDLPSYIFDQCKEAGIRTDNIQNININTAADKNQFSHYRAMRSDEREGRLLTVATFAL